MFKILYLIFLLTLSIFPQNSPNIQVNYPFNQRNFTTDQNELTLRAFLYSRNALDIWHLILNEKVIFSDKDNDKYLDFDYKRIDKIISLKKGTNELIISATDKKANANNLRIIINKVNRVEKYGYIGVKNKGKIALTYPLNKRIYKAKISEIFISAKIIAPNNIKQCAIYYNQKLLNEFINDDSYYSWYSRILEQKVILNRGNNLFVVESIYFDDKIDGYRFDREHSRVINLNLYKPPPKPKIKKSQKRIKSKHKDPLANEKQIKWDYERIKMDYKGFPSRTDAFISKASNEKTYENCIDYINKSKIIINSMDRLLNDIKAFFPKINKTISKLEKQEKKQHNKILKERIRKIKEEKQAIKLNINSLYNDIKSKKVEMKKTLEQLNSYKEILEIK